MVHDETNTVNNKEVIVEKMQAKKKARCRLLLKQKMKDARAGPKKQ